MNQKGFLKIKFVDIKVIIFTRIHLSVELLILSCLLTILIEIHLMHADNFIYIYYILYIHSIDNSNLYIHWVLQSFFSTENIRNSCEMCQWCPWSYMYQSLSFALRTPQNLLRHGQVVSCKSFTNMK